MERHYIRARQRRHNITSPLKGAICDTITCARQNAGAMKGIGGAQVKAEVKALRSKL
jgi:hypothetical protein